jgi:Tol biopolymer transport system component
MLNALLALASPASAGDVEVSWTGGGHGSNPQWSADGAWLSFEVNNNADKVDLYVVKVQNGLTPQPPTKVVIPGASSSFSAAASYAANPNWHPKQGLVIFEAANSGGTTRLYSLKPGAASPGEFLSITQAPGMLGWPAISGDGQQVAFTSSATGSGDIYLFSLATNKVALAFASGYAENSPRFNPDAKALVYTRRNSGSEDVFTYVLGASTQAPLKGGTGDQTRPRWVGSKVVYFSNERGEDHWDIAVVPASGGDRSILAKDIRFPQRAPPSVTPDGTTVLWGSSTPSQDHLIFATRLDGSGTKEINTGLSAVGDPALAVVNGRTFLAFTALPAQGSDWRQLHIMDVTGML